jgi:hypothetical protein
MPVTIEEENDRDPSRHVSDYGSGDSVSSNLSDEEEVEDEDEDEDEDDDDDEENDEEQDASPPPLHAAHANYYFAPPFYGRPGTPLPPSPSITSLLIPSRPTTPDLSDDDNTNPLEQHTAAPTPKLSSTVPKVPTYEYYGFVVYLFSSLTFLIYLLWSYLPSPFLHGLGIYYYPNRWWSLAVPAFLVMALVYLFVALAAYNAEHLTPHVGSVETVVDDAAQVAVIDARGRMRDGSRRTRSQRAKGGREKGLNYRAVWGQGTDAIMDVPLAGVCEVLHRG